MNRLKRVYYRLVTGLQMYVHRKTAPYPLMLYVTKDGNIEWIHISLMYQQLYSPTRETKLETVK